MLFVTMDSACSLPSPYTDTEPPHISCHIATGEEVKGCGQLCDSGFWASATVDDVQAELDSGANTKKTNAHGYSPLHLAARCAGDPELIAVLLEAGADANRKGPMDVTPLHVAGGFADGAILELLIDAGAKLEAKSWRRDYTPLHFAAWGDNPEGARVLLESGALPNPRAGLDRTPLVVALIEQASLATVTALLDFGASVRWDGSDRNALHIAAIHDARPEIIYLLVSRGADVNARNAFDETPLMTAFRYRSSKWTRQALAEARINPDGYVDSRNHEGKTWLHRA
ncbi:MAG: ankyrin repeat domain-containing protein, partial [Chloroflexi bacterium]|nr:ankyrin repeat domain-containing protein [Chloroflexota bacterium]